MKNTRSVARRFAIVVVFSGLIAAGLAQEAPPKEPFKAEHLLNLKSEADVAAMLRGIADQNAVVEKMGIRDTKYRLYKVFGKQNGSYTYLMESSWSGAEAYDKVHKSAEWQAISKNHPELEGLMKDEVYNRYVEARPAK